MNNEVQINNQLKEIPKLDIERREKFYDWIKNIVSISVIFLGLIISLKSNGCVSEIKHIFFVVSLICITLGIVLGLIILYSEIHTINLLRKNILIHTQELINNTNTDSNPKPAILKGYNIVIALCFFFYIVSLISIVIYSSLEY